MNEYFAIIPAKVRYDKDLSPNAKLIFGELVVLCQKEGFCWASNGYFARLYGVDKKTVSRWINQLREKGYIFFKGMDKNADTIDNFVDTLRQICISPHHKIVYPNKKENNIKNKSLARGRAKEKENCAFYDLDLYEQMINEKD